MVKMFIMPLDEVECDLQILQIEECVIPLSPTQIKRYFFLASVLCESAANLDTVDQLLGVHLELDMMGQLMGEQPAIKYTKTT